MKRAFFTCLLLAILVAGCTRSNGEQDQQPVDKSPPTAQETKALVDGMNEFAFDLYRELAAKEKGNIVISPYSISTALAMTYAGARGKTAKELAQALHLTLPQGRLHAACGALIKDLIPEEEKALYQLVTANALWGQQEMRFNPTFLAMMEQHYGGALKEVDFIHKTEQARRKINEWVEDKTKNKIKDLLQSGDLTSGTRLVLANAIYLKANWARSFPIEYTKAETFHATEKEELSVDMMSTESRFFSYAKDHGLQWLALPYHGRMTALVLLPLKQSELSKLEAGLTWGIVKSGLTKLSQHDGKVSMPRFKITSRCQLRDALHGLGIVSAFHPGSAEFPAITSESKLFIDNVIHKAYLASDENGSEAAAATAVGMATISNLPPFTFRANHPFLFLIRDSTTGCILFIGRVAQPIGV